VSPKGRHLTKNNLGDLFSLNSSVLKFAFCHANMLPEEKYWPVDYTIGLPEQ
jgi:hypothetical protein